MGIWNDLKTLGQDYRLRLPELYAKRKFPYEVRGLFADWFEEKNWNFDEHNPDNISYANDLLSTLMNKLEQFCSEPQEDLMSQMRHLDIKKQFFNEFGNKPQYFVSTVREILNDEKKLLNTQVLQIQSSSNIHNKAINSSLCDNVTPYCPQTEFALVKKTIDPSLHDLNVKVSEVDSFIKEYRNKEKEFIIQFQSIENIDGEIERASALQNGAQVDQQIQLLTQKRQEVENNLKTNAEHLIRDVCVIMTRLFNMQKTVENISTYIMEELLGWKVMLQKSLSGAPKPGSLDVIQGWFERLTDILWHFYSLAAQCKLLCDTLPILRHDNLNKEQIEKLVKDIVVILTTLIMHSFVVDKQPPQVLKTQTKFQASVRLLIGSKLNLQMHYPEVIVSILSERQCKELCQGKKLEDIGNCGEILNEKCVMEYSKDKSILQAEFKNLQLRKIKRQDRKGQESVLEAKSALVFSAKLNVNGDTLPILVMSVPVVVVVHGNQGPNSEATIIWDNMFSQPDREPFDVPEEVTWKEMSIALNARWMMINEHELHPHHLIFLKEKIYSNIHHDYNGTTEPKLPWASFNKEPLNGRNFTFWEWFHGAIEVVRKNLKDYWKSSCLEFMSRQAAHKKLLEKIPGTFLIRFSEGELGAVTIAWCSERNGHKEILMLQPWSTKDFAIRGLGDRIFDLPELTHLFPDIPKEMAFGMFRSCEVPQEINPSGYVHAGIVARILPTSNDQMSKILDESMPNEDVYHQMDYQILNQNCNT